MEITLIDGQSFDFYQSDAIEDSLRNFENEISQSKLNIESLKKSGYRISILYLHEKNRLLHVDEFNREFFELTSINPIERHGYIEVLLIASVISEVLKEQNICRHRKYRIANVLSSYIGLAKGIRSILESEAPRLIKQQLALAKRNLAQEGANSRHKESHACKAEVFKWADENMHMQESMDDAAQVIATELVPYKFRTVRQWLTEWKKLRAAGIA